MPRNARVLSRSSPPHIGKAFIVNEYQIHGTFYLDLLTEPIKKYEGQLS